MRTESGRYAGKLGGRNHTDKNEGDCKGPCLARSEFRGTQCDSRNCRNHSWNNNGRAYFGSEKKRVAHFCCQIPNIFKEKSFFVSFKLILYASYLFKSCQVPAFGISKIGRAHV